MGKTPERMIIERAAGSVVAASGSDADAPGTPAAVVL
jgi:hypothetical protein